MPPHLTAVRLQFLHTLLRLTREFGVRVSEATISALRDLRYVERPGARGRLFLTEKALALIRAGIPIYGQIAAGPPILAEQNPDDTTPNLDVFLGVREGDFLLRVSGDSMTGIGVMDGTHVLW